MTTQAMTESEALRSLNLPSSRRAWLREQIAGTDVGSCIIYDRQAVEALASMIQSHVPAALLSSLTMIPERKG